ncbi:hypothetical protein M409DRAFT_23334 [Zasmidium cellare ATCC 36951]|uniref:Uncharacterized protein n=1 Tax=Zasmidium cellare ATCC 36951 TaxID=1080233 RepID=A0A6A6CG13_ZASCE|nr:uncharacterized protein M409DRAFT_23334 [Zasmidium cellare ATCC 36951]KAF2166144.1 hypothetical protein M409DRAFT_23334 [Zasmidium cellare ATCC 36951]
MATANARKQHENSNVFMPKPGAAGNRRRSAHGPAKRPVTRPLPPGRTSTGGVQQSTSINKDKYTSHNNVNGQPPPEPFLGPGPGYHGPAPAPVAQMTAPGDEARDAEVATLSQQLKNLPSSLTPAVVSDSEASSSEPGEVAEIQESLPQQPLPQSVQPAVPSTQPSAVPSIDLGERTRRAAAVKAGQQIEELEASLNRPLSQTEAEYFKKVYEIEARRSQEDSLFVRGTTEDHFSDQDIADDEDEPESTPPSPVVANKTTPARKRPSPEPEVSDGAKKQKTFSTDFRTRAYDRLKPEGKIQRDALLYTIRKNWGPRWEAELSQDLWLIDSKTKRPQNPKNWGNPALERIIQLSALTPKAPGRAASALKEAIARRTSTGQGSRRLERVEDVEVAKQLVAQNDPQVGRAPPPSPPLENATLGDVLRASASSTATLDHETPSRGSARRTSGSTSANISPARQTVAGASSSPQVKQESDEAPFSPKSPRLNQPRKVYAVAELFKLDIDTLEKAYRNSIAQWSQVEREMARRRSGNNNLVPLNRELSKLNSEALFQLYQESYEQKLLLVQELQGRTPEVLGADSSVPMVLDD